MAAGAAITGLGEFPLEAFARRELVKLTILHTNDVHSRIDPFPANDPRYAGMGGAARRAAVIAAIRREEANVLLFDSGDMFQGTPYFNLYGGEAELKVMSWLGYDAGTVGNHDFDNGVGNLARQLEHARFPLLCANYDFNGTPLQGRTLPWQVFERGGLKVGVFGLGIELRGLVDPELYGATRYLDPLEKAAETAHLLKKTMGCDLVVCLSHLGFNYKDGKVCDTGLAKASLHIDLILGGHTHTFIDTPYTYYNRDGRPVLVAQVGWGGIRLGRIDWYFEPRSGRNTPRGTTVKISRKSSEK
jgi:5'-nucleotidase